MKTEELRIGNLVFNNDDKIVKADLEILERISKKNLFPYSIWNYTPVKLTEDILREFGFTEKRCVNFDWKNEYVISIDKYAWELGVILGDYEESNPNIGCLSILQSEDEQISAVPEDLLQKEDWTESDMKRAAVHTIASKAWRQPIAYWIKDVHQLQNIVFGLTGFELTFKTK